jgi:predicted nucleic acid-binding protein
VTGLYLIDKSALARWPQPVVAERLDELSDLGLLAVCAPVEIEMLYSARSDREAARIADGLRWFDLLPIPDETWDRAKEVQRAAVGKGFHRALSMADLLISATAERHDRIVLHYDGDFDMITSLTGQRTEWVVPPGTADR